MTNLTKPTKVRGKNGGKRPGAGIKHGFKYPKTITKERALEGLRTLVIAELEPMTRAQMNAAKGIDHFMLRDPDSGQFRRLTDPEEIVAALNAPNAAEGSTFWIYSKDPSTGAYTDLMNRALGKPVDTQQIEHTGAVSFGWMGDGD